jgi:cell division transport system permease protein
MKYLKSHITLIFSLVALLFSYQLYLTVSDLADKYEHKLANEYSIVAVSTQKIEERTFKHGSYLVASAEEIDAQPFFAGFSNDLAPEVYEQLKTSLPSFYRIKLNKYPSKEELVLVTKSLKSLRGVIKVESFARTQNAIANLLDAFKSGVSAYLAVVFVFNILLFIKFMEVWRFEHISRMQIMAIFGAPVWMRSIVLIKMALVDSFFAVAITIGAFYYLSISPDAALYLKSIGLDGGIYFDIKESLIHLGALALGVSLFAVSMVAFRRLES